MTRCTQHIVRLFSHRLSAAALLTCLLAAFVWNAPPTLGGQTKKKKTAKRAAVTSSSKKKSSGKKSARKRKAKKIRRVPLKTLSVVRERTLGDGVRYTMYRSDGSRPVVVHAISMDRTIAGNALRLLKGEDHANCLERLGDLYRRYDSTSGHTVYSMINGNFWRAVRNTMIGPCVIDGEVVEMNAYKRWTSAFFDVKGQAYIDTFRLSGRVVFRGQSHSISSVNRRTDSGLVVYNSFGGKIIPHVSAKEVERDFSEAVKDSVFMDRDSTEVALTKDVLRAEIARAQREATAEFPTIKLRVRYLRSPSVNVATPCQVLAVDSGAVNMPLRGAVITFPRNHMSMGVPSVGDTVVIEYTTDRESNVRFMNAVCGTPRLVRNGIPKHEARQEGSTGRRFIEDGLARTAIGVDRSGNRLILVAIPADRPDLGTYGATLAQTATIMTLLGAYQAMNLDGGGSAGMVIEKDHVFFEGPDPLTRRVGLGIGVVRLAKVLRGIR